MADDTLSFRRGFPPPGPMGPMGGPMGMFPGPMGIPGPVSCQCRYYQDVC